MNDIIETNNIVLNTGGSNTLCTTNTPTAIYTDYSTFWSKPVLLDVIENPDCIELIYKETSTLTHLTYPSRCPEDKVFKIIFSCVDGKWNKSDRIYGEIVPAQHEQYLFDD